ncbi:hypothetical protein BH10CYA1_BH10CYA1_11190 [soil metagenome]
MNVKSATFSFMVAWTTFCSTATFGDTTADLITPGSLKKNGAVQLNVRFEDSSSDAPQHAWLQGVSNEKVVWKKPVPLKFAVNTAKTDVICRNGRIEVVSQYPGSAAYTNQTFTWDGNKVSFVSKKDGDASQEQVDKLMKLALNGTHQQLDDFDNDEHVIFYPDNYINTNNIKAMLTAGRKQALALAAAHKPLQAAQRMEICLDASMALVYLEGDTGEKKTAPAKWIEAWSVDRIALPASFWKPILNDYSTLLKASGKVKQAAAIAR